MPVVKYHTGFLAIERASAHRNASSINDKAVMYWSDYMDGQCLLFQRRIGPMEYEYLAAYPPHKARRY